MNDTPVRVGHLPYPYELGVAYADGKPIGRLVQPQVVMDHPEKDHLRTYIEAFLMGNHQILYPCSTGPVQE